jgi:hypothetical protein
MLKITATPSIQANIRHLKQLKAQKDQLDRLYKDAQQDLLNDPTVQQAIYNEMTQVNERGQSLTGTVELHDTNNQLLATIFKVGWDMKLSQPQAVKYLHDHPEAAVFLEPQVKPKTRNLIQAANHDESLTELLGLSYQEATPYLKVV